MRFDEPRKSFLPSFPLSAEYARCDRGGITKPLWLWLGGALTILSLANALRTAKLQRIMSEPGATLLVRATTCLIGFALAFVIFSMLGYGVQLLVGR